MKQSFENEEEVKIMQIYSDDKIIVIIIENNENRIRNVSSLFPPQVILLLHLNRLKVYCHDNVAILYQANIMTIIWLIVVIIYLH